MDIGNPFFDSKNLYRSVCDKNDRFDISQKLDVLASQKTNFQCIQFKFDSSEKVKNQTTDKIISL